MATDEAALVTRSRRAALLHGIYVILNEQARVLALADAALDGGVRVLQYRAKAGIDAAHLQQLRERTRARGALLLVNDDWRAALAFDCDGVHLGPDDDGFALAALRAALGDRLIGLSCGTVEEAARANASDVDYLGVGAVYATGSKADAGEPIGLAGLQRVAAASRYPVAAIGGIGAAQLDEVRASGVAMAAVISAFAGADDPRAAARMLVERWHAGRP
ncbi:MAG TPA: thiamine phosphate synthase [Candidatus Acidoferrales bacterium]|nr:thiamine phosphate synthase [Candidatus Acidoferrales bacterium]